MGDLNDVPAGAISEAMLPWTVGAGGLLLEEFKESTAGEVFVWDLGWKGEEAGTSIAELGVLGEDGWRVVRLMICVGCVPLFMI